MTKALRKSAAAVRKAPKEPKEPAWADRFPLGTATAFAELAVKTDDNGHGPLVFVFSTVASCLGEEELERFHMALWRIRDLVSEEQKRRRVHGVLRRVRA